MKLQLHDSVSSPQDLKAVISEVQQYAAWFAHVAVKKRLEIDGGFEPPAISPAANALIQEYAGNKPLSRELLDELIAALKAFEDTAASITITLAAAPSNGLKKELVVWCRKHIEPNILVNFRFNSTLLGGMVVHYGSHIYDWSFQRQILAARGRFPEVLRRV
jgi:F0F1-type ATP synthase delta subunit